jgi:S1-C subfamily serine protease
MDNGAPPVPPPPPTPEPPELVRLSAEEIAKAVPPPPRPRWQQPPPPPSPKGPRTSRLAAASLILGILGLPLTMLVGTLAMLAGALGLGAISADPELKGRRLAVIGLALGIVSFIGWSIGLWYYLGKPGAQMPEGPPQLLQATGGPPPEELKNSPEPYRSALLANVVIMGSAPNGGQWSGSGVVIDREGEVLRILTNRHVAEGMGPGIGPAKLWVMLSTGESTVASSVWRAPAGIDLCILELKAGTASQVSPVKLTVKIPTVAEEVFAVGNPLEYRWSLTKGVVSSVRKVEVGGVPMKVFQTQTPISSGNSGGGLYSLAGLLIGVNTWTADKTLSEGLGFSISMETLMDHLGKVGLPWSARLLESARK